MGFRYDGSGMPVLDRGSKAGGTFAPAKRWTPVHSANPSSPLQALTPARRHPLPVPHPCLRSTSDTSGAA